MIHFYGSACVPPGDMVGFPLPLRPDKNGVPLGRATRALVALSTEHSSFGHFFRTH